MPQIDFGEVFSDPPSKPPSQDDGSISKQPQVSPPASQRSNSAWLLPGQHGWANIAFTIIAVLGGLFCVLHFFKDTELVRAATSWPQSYRYEHSKSLGGAGTDQVHPATPPALSPTDVGNSGSRNAGDPFSRVSDLLSLRPSSPKLAPGRTGRSLYDLALPAPGGDALLQAFDRAVSDLQKAGQAKPDADGRAGRGP